MQEDLLALDRQVCFALAAASRSVVALYRPVLDPLGLTHPQYLVMLALWERSPRRVRDIADQLLLDSATLSPLLKRLESAKLLERRRDPEDERALSVTLTPAGAQLRARAEAVPAEVVHRLQVPLEDLEAMRDQLSRLLRASEGAQRRAAAMPEPAPVLT